MPPPFSCDEQIPEIYLDNSYFRYDTDSIILWVSYLRYEELFEEMGCGGEKGGA